MTSFDFSCQEIQELLYQESYEQVDEILANMDLENTEINKVIGCLAETLDYSKYLPSRKRIYEHLEEYARRKGIYSLISGLKGRD